MTVKVYCDRCGNEYISGDEPFGNMLHDHNFNDTFSPLKMRGNLCEDCLTKLQQIVDNFMKEGKAFKEEIQEKKKGLLFGKFKFV